MLEDIFAARYRRREESGAQHDTGAKGHSYDISSIFFASAGLQFLHTPADARYRATLLGRFRQPCRDGCFILWCCHSAQRAPSRAPKKRKATYTMSPPFLQTSISGAGLRRAE